MELHVVEPGKLVTLSGTTQVTNDHLVLNVAVTDPAPPPPPPPATLKAPAVGFLTRDRLVSIGGRQTPGFVNVGWDELEPTRGSFTGAGWNTINTLLGQGTRSCRLRIFAGVSAPSWAKQLGGAAISITNPGIPDTGTIGRFWTPEFQDAYASLMAEVARRYDADDRVADVVVSGAMTFFAEPFIRSGTDTASNTRLFQAGLNYETDRDAMSAMVDIHAAAFARTRFSLATHLQWQVIDDTADHMTLSWERERALLLELRALYGNRLVIQNNGAGSVPSSIPLEPAASATNMWTFFRAIPGPKGFQGGYKTAPPAQTLDRCIKTIGAWFFENIHGDLTDTQILDYQNRMLANASA